MSNFLNFLKISNFKSIKSMEFDCKRVNVLIGKPNVGKSNILEALSILSAHYAERPTKRFLREFIRYDETSNFAYDDDISKTILVETDKVSAILKFRHDDQNLDCLIWDASKIEEAKQNNVRDFSELTRSFSIPESKIENPFWHPCSFYINSIGEYGSGIPINLDYHNPVKSYRFDESKNYSNRFSEFLKPAFGPNLFGVIDQSHELKKEITRMFVEQGLDFVISRKEAKFELQKLIDGVAYKYPYSGVADTFKRLIFYLAAVESNQDSVLIFEEPEVHAFPPYTKMLADRISDCETNQFFISTHSPYLLNTLIENVPDSELNVGLVYFEDYQTKIHILSPEELKHVLDYSIDVFFNLDKFLENGAAAKR